MGDRYALPVLSALLAEIAAGIGQKPLDNVVLHGNFKSFVLPC